MNDVIYIFLGIGALFFLLMGIAQYRSQSADDGVGIGLLGIVGCGSFGVAVGIFAVKAIIKVMS